MTLTVTSSDLDLVLDMGGAIDGSRADLLISLAEDLCTAIVSPVPDNARAVVLSIAARAYLNPQGVQAETIGPQTVTFGSSMVGLYITGPEVTTLKRFAGVGGAFSIDPTPTDAGTQLYPWDLNIWYLGLDGGLVEAGFDMPASEAGMWQ